MGWFYLSSTVYTIFLVFICNIVMPNLIFLHYKIVLKWYFCFQKKIKGALRPNPPTEVLVEGFGLQIKRCDIHTLNNLNWLNDEVFW